MRSGALRQKGMLQDRSASRDSLGGQNLAWIDVAPVRFALQPQGGREFNTADAVRNQSTFTIMMRFRRGMNETMRIVGQGAIAGRVFNFVNINDVDERHRDLEITAIEGLSPPAAGLSPPV
jgi:SPP1 family predicted phage head-tail adaptor